MLTDLDGGYDVGYRAVTGFWGTAPSSLVVHYLAANDVTGLRVLDAGAGEGKNAAAFSRGGAVVDAVECSRAAIENARKLFPDNPITWIQADITKLNIPVDSYDVVVCYGLIHCLASEEVARATLETLKRTLRPGGVFILCSFNDGGHDLSAHPGFSPLLMPHDWFRAMFADWRLEEITDSVLFETHPHNNIPHHHSLSRLRAVRT